MSSDLRSVLHAAATVPATDANVTGAWNQGRRMRARRLAASGVAIVAIIALASAAVASIVPNNGKSPIVPATTPSKQTTTTTKRETTTTTIRRNTTSTVVAASTCATANLTVTLGPPSGAAGSMGYELQFRNDSGAPCTMTGFPGVSFLDASGAPTGVSAGRNPVSYATVTVAPGSTAYALLIIGNPDNFGCPSALVQQVRVFPPNETTSVVIDTATIRICSNNTPSNFVDPAVSSPTQ
jgi:hypothetical protein